jgi:hypothetical protein
MMRATELGRRSGGARSSPETQVAGGSPPGPPPVTLSTSSVTATSPRAKPPLQPAAPSAPPGCVCVSTMAAVRMVVALAFLTTWKAGTGSRRLTTAKDARSSNLPVALRSMRTSLAVGGRAIQCPPLSARAQRYVRSY